LSKASKPVEDKCLQVPQGKVPEGCGRGHIVVRSFEAIEMNILQVPQVEFPRVVAEGT